MGLGVLTCNLQNYVASYGKRKGEGAETDEGPSSSGLFWLRGTDISRTERRGHSLEAAPARTAPELVNWGSGVLVRRSSGHFYGSFPSECYSPRHLQGLPVLNIKGCSWILNKLMGSRRLMSKKFCNHS